MDLRGRIGPRDRYVVDISDYVEALLGWRPLSTMKLCHRPTDHGGPMISFFSGFTVYVTSVRQLLRIQVHPVLLEKTSSKKKSIQTTPHIYDDSSRSRS